MLYTVCINTDRDRLTKIIIANSIKKQSDAASAVS